MTNLKLRTPNFKMPQFKWKNAGNEDSKWKRALKNKKTYYAGSAILLVGLILLGSIPKPKASVFNDKEGIVSQGVVEARETSINSKIPGRIGKIYVEEGDEVKAGDVLVEITSDEIKAKKEQAVAQAAAAQAAYDAAKGQTEAAKANLDKAENGARAQEIAQAQVAYDLAVKSLDRVEELYNNKKEQTQSLIETAKAAYEAAKGQTAAAKAMADKAEKGARDQEIAQAQAQYDLATKTYERVSKLYEKGAVSAQKRDEVKTQLNVVTQMLSMAKEGARIEDKNAAQAMVTQALANEDARKAQLEQAQAGLDEVEYTFGLKRDEAQAQVEIRRQTLNLAKEGARVEDKSGAQALYTQALAMEQAAKSKLDQAQGGVDEVEAYLKDTKIVAPTDGFVTAINANEGELVSTGMSIASVSDLNTMWVEVKVKETDLQGISLNQMVNVKVPGYSHDVFEAKVTKINKKPDFATKRSTNDNGSFDILSFGVKVEFDKGVKALRPGMTAFTQFRK